MKPLSVYIHIPFCRSKCAYCDFASFPGREGDWEAYFRALCGEIDGAGSDAHRVETVFFGGGTPSLVPHERIADVLQHVRRAFSVSPDAEISLEANPGTLTMEKLSAYRAMGVNRLSIGVQSFDAGLLKGIGRIHALEDAEDAVRMARAAGFQNISLDLMYALPGQRMEQWEATVSRAIALSPEHISAYSLIVEDGTPIAERISEIPADGDVIAMQRRATEMLDCAGYRRYEISNYARDGFACRHNKVYWRRGEYLGFGSAAHSFFGGERFENPPGLPEYLAGRRGLNRARIGPRDAEEETILLATRMCEGLSLSAFRDAFGRDFRTGRERAVETLVGHGLAEFSGGFFRLTGRGMEVQNAAVLSLVEDG